MCWEARDVGRGAKTRSPKNPWKCLTGSRPPGGLACCRTPGTLAHVQSRSAERQVPWVKLWPIGGQIAAYIFPLFFYNHWSQDVAYWLLRKRSPHGQALSSGQLSVASLYKSSFLPTPLPSPLAPAVWDCTL